MEKLTKFEKIVWLAFRCEYIANADGSSPLTKKGRGLIPPFIWRMYNRVMMVIDKEHRRMMYTVLDDIHSEHTRLTRNN